MLLGKRARRHPMKRTTSMTEFSFEDLTVHPNNHNHNHNQGAAVPPPPFDLSAADQRVMAMVSPRNTIQRRNSADYGLQQQHSQSQARSFLATCSLCKRRLPPGRDIFMYRGDSAFCSLECRQQKMTQDEWREKCSVSVSTTTSSNSNKESNSSHSTSTTAGSTVVSSAKGETVAAL